MKTESIAKKTIRVVISSFLSLVLALSFVLFGLLPLLQTVSSADSWLQLAQQSAYAEKMRENLLKKYTFLSETSGVPASVCSAFLEEELPFDLAISPISKMFSDDTASFDREKITEAFCKKVEAYAMSLRESGELEISEEEWTEMKEDFPVLAKYYVDEFSSAMNMSGIFSMLASPLRMVKKIISPVAVAAGIFFVFAFVLLVLIQKKKVFVFGYLGFVSAGILLFAPALWLKMGNYLSRLGVEPVYLKDLIVTLGNTVIQKMLNFGIAYFVLGVIFGILAIIIYKKEKKSKEENNDQTPSKCDA